ncbi:uncharacterized protein LOC110852955 [Folsomia candida]|uniref:uncharacterized protein LOC110852955 n=1 Tax=Folsomia candida TaxID=158441 RepID=UPI00160509E7|nr:uncharacterized protein LOC110852955 [Folsomia candida]
MDSKLEHRSKIALFFLILGAVVFALLFLTAPKPKSGPTIRVLHISYADQSMTTTKLKPTIPNTVVINVEELKLSPNVQQFYRNNIVLECAADFPVMWQYSGQGTPHVRVHDTRKYDDFNDTTTYSYLSSLNLMPISETSSGRYSCRGLGGGSDDDGVFDFVQLFVPGPKVFLLQTDINIESDLSQEMLIPCQVSDPAANVSLLRKGDVVEDKFIKWYRPASGFALNAKFMEEQDAPLAAFFVCQDRNTKRRSGKVTLSLKKDLLVLVQPSTETVTLNSDGSNATTFSCHAKENITLKFRRIQKFRRVQHAINSSADFGFTAFVTFESSDVKEGSFISCITVSQGSLLHGWTVSLAQSEEMQDQTIKLTYKDDTNEYTCCGTATNRPKLAMLSCYHPVECAVLYDSCPHLSGSLEDISSSKSCGDQVSPRFSERGTCLPYKVDYATGGGGGNASMGQLRCGPMSKGTGAEWHYFVNIKSENDTVVQDFGVSDLGQTPTTIPNPIDPNNLADFLLGVETIYNRTTSAGTSYKYGCKGPRFFFAAGFMWQVVRQNGLLEYVQGIDHFDGAWVVSEIQFEDTFSRKVRKIYCIAPLWNSETRFVLKTTTAHVPNT